MVVEPAQAVEVARAHRGRRDPPPLEDGAAPARAVAGCPGGPLWLRARQSARRGGEGAGREEHAPPALDGRRAVLGALRRHRPLRRVRRWVQPDDRQPAPAVEAYLLPLPPPPRPPGSLPQPSRRFRRAAGRERVAGGALALRGTRTPHAALRSVPRTPQGVAAREPGRRGSRSWRRSAEATCARTREACSSTPSWT